jgi:hypothetical protein
MMSLRSLFHEEGNIERNGLLEAVDHAFHQRKDLAVDDIDLVHGEGDVLEHRFLTFGLRQHEAVVDLEAVDFFIYRPVLVFQ